MDCPAANAPPTTQPMLVPTTMSTGTFISRNARNTPMCAKPRAPPPDKTNATRGRAVPTSTR